MEGEAAIPLSWRSYLYANANPLYYVDKNGESATVVGSALGFAWGVGQAIGGFITDKRRGESRDASDYLGTVVQNTIAGAEIGLSIDAAVLSGGVGIALSGAAGNAGLGALTVGGRGASAAEFAEQQQKDALVGGLLGGVLAKTVPWIGKVGSAIAERTPEAVKVAVEVAADKAAGIYEHSGASRVVAKVEKALGEALVKEGGKKELTAEAVPGVQRSAAGVSSQAEEAAARAVQLQTERQVTADVAGEAERPTAASLSDLDFVQKIATKSESTGVRSGQGASGTGSAQGIWKHVYAKRVLERYQRITGQKTDLVGEQSYINGPFGKSQAAYGQAGSVRPDVYNPITGELFDYKFVANPGRGLGSAQRIRNANNVPGLTKQYEVNP